MALYPVNPKTEFARLVSKGTGLDFEVVLGWVQAEGGPPGNPLNIGPGRNYGTTEKAAAATVSLLHTARYAPVLKAARQGDRNAQVRAIASSPWDQCHYQGFKRVGGEVVCLANPPGTRLVGAINAATDLQLKPPTGIAGGVRKAIGDAPGAVAGAAGKAAGKAVSAALSPVADAITGAFQWIGKEVALALAYVVLTLAAAALFVLGVMRSTGTSPSELARAYAGRGGGIPY